jgi:hypothetical protein
MDRKGLMEALVADNPALAVGLIREKDLTQQILSAAISPVGAATRRFHWFLLFCISVKVEACTMILCAGVAEKAK